MSKLSGVDLYSHLSKTPGNLIQNLNITKQLFLAYKKQVLGCGLVYRDIKSENIMIDNSSYPPNLNMID